MVRGNYECRLKGKFSEPLLERLSPCCGWGRVSSLDYLLFLKMEERARDCESFEPLTFVHGRDTSPPSCKTCTSQEEGGKEGA
ncbi:MAG: hypothetical protein DSO03_07245 [Hadesarchaea archaeon]|nr:MAG: hypothetical protein DSO03_07245 [Hadesarchaea archaeon]